MIFTPASKPLHGTIDVPGDKSISHRAVMLGSLAEGDTEISHFLPGADCLSTIACFRKMGIHIELTENNTHVVVHGRGLHGLSAPDSVLDCGNSGTTTRLISGILAGQKFSSALTGDESIRKRPMNRIILPLSEMGAKIRSENENSCVPLQISPSRLKGICYQSLVASAQVKSCILLAGMYAEGQTSVTEPSLSRNHTELMLRGFGAEVTSEGTTATITPEPVLHGRKLTVPGDISSAAYFLCAGLMVPDSEVLLKHVGTNPTRDGILRVIQEMGGSVTYRHLLSDAGESTADLEVRYSRLHGTVIEGDLIPTLIDELPVIAVLAATAEGDTVIRDAQELRYKESDRLALISENLEAMGVSVDPTEDGMIIHGRRNLYGGTPAAEGKPLHGAVIDSHKDHRLAMSFAIAALAADGETEIRDAQCVNISYPDFYRDLQSLSS